MKSPSLSLLYTTLPTLEEAEKLAHLVLNEKLAACVNIFPQGRSIYLWKENIEDNAESYLLFKTTNVENLLKFIQEHHPYEIPALLYWEAGCSKDFFEYVDEA